MASEGLVRRPGSGMRSPTSGATSPSQPRSRSQSPSPPFTPDPDDDLHPTNSKTYLAHRSTHPSNFTFRALVVGSLIGIIIAFSNTYFGLQTGWISGMVMPSALIGFASFRVLTPLLDASPLTPVENVLVQTVAQSVGTMPLGCGFVGVIPALEFLLNPTEVAAENIGGVNKKGLDLGLSKLLVWALGVCFFGVVFGVPLRKQLVIREKLKFPSGTATALMIGVLHGSEDVDRVDAKGGSLRRRGLRAGDEDESRGLMERERDRDEADEGQDKGAKARDWRHKIKLMTVAFSGSAFYTVLTYFVPQLHNLPILGTHLAKTWVWTLNPSPAYVGQGIIMGPSTCLHMLLGAVLGWAVLSPLAKSQRWAPGPVDDWETGSKGWILWVSLAIMLADAIINLGWLVVRPTWRLLSTHGPSISRALRTGTMPDLTSYTYASLSASNDISGEEPDAPASQLISTRTTIITGIVSVILCILAVQYTFSSLVSIPLTLLSLLLAALLSIMSCRAIGETDLNPVSGISKLTQLIFALVTPPSSPHGLIINLVAGGISEAGTLQAGDLLQDLKTGHLLGASPKAQFWGQMVGSAVGAVVSAVVYRLYTNVYTVPGDMFRVPTGYVWVFTARLVMGRGLPPRAVEAALVAGLLWSGISVVKVWGHATGRKWTGYLPGGIAVAIGMYNVPSFTLARAVGGLLAWYWVSIRKQSETPLVLLASGLILGEGLLSILNLALASASVPHL